MRLNQIMKFFVYRLAMVLVSCTINVSSQCNDQLKSCSHGLCNDDCGTSTASGTGVEVIVAVMSVSVALILGLVILLVYVCVKQGLWTQSSDAPSNENTTCESTAVEIPEYLMRRRFSSLSMTTGPPPYFSLFRFSLNGVGEIQSTVIGENVTTENARLPSVEQPPEYRVLFGQCPPPYEHVVKSEPHPSQIVGPVVSANTGC